MMERQTSLATLPQRVKGAHLSKFRPLQIVSNHFEVKLSGNFQSLYIFSIKFEPRIPADNKSKITQILKSLMGQIETFIPNPAICGMNLISNQKPSLQSQQFIKGEYRMNLKHVKTIDAKNDKNSLLFFLNNRLRNVMSRNGYQQIGRSSKFFNLKNKKSIDNLSMYSGFRANFCVLQKGIFLRANDAKKIVRNQTVLQFINDIYAKNQDKQRDDRRNIVTNQLKGKIVQTNYGNGKYYTIEDVKFIQMAEYTLEGQKMNMIQYYQNKYNITIRKPKQPLLKAENKRGKIEILLVPELCLMTGIPDDFDEFKRKKISQETIIPAREKQMEIMGLIKQVQRTPDFDNLEKIGVKLSRKLHSFEARQIPTPRISLGNKQQVQRGKQSFFNLFAQPIYNAKRDIKLAILYFRADLKDMIRTFENTSQKLKVDFSYDKFALGDDRRAVENVQKTVRQIKDKGKHNIILLVIPPFLKNQYKRFKQIMLLDNKMVCQIATQANFRKKNAQSIFTKILLQIIAKRGNTLWAPEIQSKIDDTMLIGFDTAKISGDNNILAGVGTVNSSFTSFCTRIGQYDGNEGKYQQMKNLMIQMINSYFDRNKKVPINIIIFMNSITTTQQPIVNQCLIHPLIEKLQEIYHEKAPSIQIVTINTKTNERFFTKNGQNVNAGTLVSSDVVSVNYDFFLISQNANRGCAVPNHYKVLYNNSKMQEGVLGEIIFSQCFNYVNWSGSIKIPGVLQYAKKCAKFNSEVVNKQVSTSLQKYLYFV